MVDPEVVLSFNSIGEAAIDTLKSEFLSQNRFIR
jgi:hypothetical protein